MLFAYFAEKTARRIRKNQFDGGKNMKTSTRIISILCIVTLLVSCLGMSLGISAAELPITSTVFWQNSAQTADRISYDSGCYDNQPSYLNHLCSIKG